MRILLCLAAVFSVFGSFTHAQVIQGTWPAEGGPITIFPVDEESPVIIQGIDFTDISGNKQLNRVGGNNDSPSPFQLFVTPLIPTNGVDQVTVGNLGFTVEIDGPTTLNLITVSETADVCDIRVGDGTADGPHPLSAACGAQGLVATFPAEGGPLTLVGQESGIQGLDLIDISGKNQLNRLEGVAQPTPFTFFVAPFTAQSNVAQVTVGNLGTVYDLDGEVTVAGITVNGGAVEADFESTFGQGGGAVSFPVRPIPEPATGIMATFGLIGLLGLRQRR